MSTTYAQNPSTAQNVASTKAASILDSSSQGDALQRKAETATHQNRMNKFTDICSNSKVAQRLVLQHGNAKNIQDDATKIALEHDKLRKKKIAVQKLRDIDESCFDIMMSKEPIYIVSHGISALGEKKAHLEGDSDGDDVYEDEIACIISNIVNKLNIRGKEIGNIKLEACLSSDKSLGKSSLVEGVNHHCNEMHKDKTINIMGNSGLAQGTDYDEEGVTVTNPVASKMCLLMDVLLMIDENNKGKKSFKSVDGVQMLKKDGFDLITSILKELEEPEYEKIKEHVKKQIAEFSSGMDMNTFFEMIKSDIDRWDVGNHLNCVIPVVLTCKDVERIKVPALGGYDFK